MSTFNHAKAVNFEAPQYHLMKLLKHMVLRKEMKAATNSSQDTQSTASVTETLRLISIHSLTDTFFYDA